MLVISKKRDYRTSMTIVAFALVVTNLALIGADVYQKGSFADWHTAAVLSDSTTKTDAPAETAPAATHSDDSSVPSVMTNPVNGQGFNAVTTTPSQNATPPTGNDAVDTPEAIPTDEDGVVDLPEVPVPDPDPLPEVPVDPPIDPPADCLCDPLESATQSITTVIDVVLP